jgi:hypothetical protein
MKLSALASLVLVLGLASPSLAQNARWNELTNLPFQQGYPTEETAQRLMEELLFERGDAGHETGVGGAFWRWLQRPASVEGAPERKDAGHYAQLGRDLRDGLCRSWQGWATRHRVAAQSTGHPRRLLATSGVRSDCR